MRIGWEFVVDRLEQVATADKKGRLPRNDEADCLWKLVRLAGEVRLARPTKRASPILGYPFRAPAMGTAFLRSVWVLTAVFLRCLRKASPASGLHTAGVFVLCRQGD